MPNCGGAAMADCAPVAYFDYAATTPVGAAARQAFVQALEFPGNAGAAHTFGLRARAALEEARGRFAEAIGADAREIVFTSGATEANNLALKGAFAHHEVKHPRLVTLQSEHKAVLDPAGILAKSGVDCAFLPVQGDGLLDLACLEEALQSRPPTVVSIMAVNNETGVIQPMAAIARLVHQYGGKLHVDAAQALGKTALDVRAWDADMVSFSGHKTYAPQGIGALFVRRLPKMRLQAQLHGGGQERGRRSGTQPLALICAFAAAADEAAREQAVRSARVQAHCDALFAALPHHMRLLRPLEKTSAVPHIVCIDTAMAAGRVLALADKAGLALSAGSACQSDADGSHVVRAMGHEAAARRTIRVSLSHLTDNEDIRKLTAFLHSLETHD